MPDRQMHLRRNLRPVLTPSRRMLDSPQRPFQCQSSETQYSVIRLVSFQEPLRHSAGMS